ncbi:Os01g0133799, partial [Oryza sativa Japonica Group]
IDLCISAEANNLGSQLEQRRQRVGRELAREHEANVASLAVVRAVAGAAPHLPEELLGDVPCAVAPRVRPPRPPLRVRERPVGVAAPPEQADQRRDVVLVDEAAPAPGAGVAERREVALVGDDLDGEGAVHLEELGPLAPLRRRDVVRREQRRPVARAGAGVVEAVDEAVVGSGEVSVQGGEVEDGDARLGQQREALV